ncbi:MAG: bifunctional glutamate N-acetyltransferase/amino-acid acetyltransferase ArgJ [Candidatus Hinthialibacter antarcticus]|nr:bifunctional glutamate N-acetyltransferase/amino-acid acetyltransferase ArgJ [Candidatus Hinthialibacter antarcticus]
MSYTIETIESGGVTSPQGFRAGGVAAGIKKSGALDIGVLVSESRCAAAGVFTTNRLKGASLLTTHRSIQDGYAQAVYVNSGNANACTGDQGLKDAQAIARHIAEKLGLAENDALPNSTGVIGAFLPMDKVLAGIDALLPNLNREGGADFARAMMTTDTVAKFSARKVTMNGKTFTLGASAKGSGMIHPNMATMLSFISCDAKLSPQAASTYLREACDQTFNRLTIDGDTSCDDTVLLLANGASGVEIDPEGETGEAFANALNDLCSDMVLRLAHDGEGVTKVAYIKVEGAASKQDATQVAKTIAISPLVKTALHGCDPNWGRIINAAGYSGVDLDLDRADLWLDDIQLFANGQPAKFSEDAAHQIMLGDEYTFRLALNAGDASDWYITTDFSKEYVDINADYRHRT